MPASLILSSITSRVVPAISVTIAFSSPTRILSKEDLPAFGLPTITVLIPSFNIFPLSALSYNLLTSFKIISVFDKSDIEIMRLICNKKIIVLLNKSDLPSVVDEKKILKYLHSSVHKQESDKYTNYDSDIFDINFNKINDQIKIIKTSTKDSLGMEELESTIETMFSSGIIKMNDQVILTNLRQKEAVKEALNSLLMVRRSIEDHMPEDFISIDLMGAYSALGNVIGEEVGEDLVNEIFSKFCMGK